jgi:hypothetical protein
MLRRTQLMLGQELKSDLFALARFKNKSVSSLVRGMLSDAVRKENRSLGGGVDSLLAMAKNTQRRKLSGPKDLARNHDYYLYGSSKNEVDIR